MSKESPISIQEHRPAQFAYVLTYPGDEQRGSLTALFVDHGVNARWPQVQLLNTYWNIYKREVSQRTSKGMTVIHEGPGYDITGLSFDRIIQNHSEPGHLLYLVGKEKEDNPDTNIKAVSGEEEDFGISSVQTFIKDNKSTFDMGDISDNNLLAVYFGGRLYPQYCEGDEEKTFKEYVQSNRSFQKVMQLGITYDDFVETFERLYPDVEHNNFVKNGNLLTFLCNQTLRSHYRNVPEQERSVIQKISQACNEGRDIYLPDLISDELNRGRHVFMSYGGPHWFLVQKRLKERGLPVKTLISCLPPMSQDPSSV